MKKLDRIVEKTLLKLARSEKDREELKEVLKTGEEFLVDIIHLKKVALAVARAIFEDIENNFEEYFEYNEFEDAVEIYPKTWQDFKKKWCGE